MTVRINPPSFKIANEAQILLGNATENSQSKKADIEQNCELAVAQSNDILGKDLCQKIRLSLNETASFNSPVANNTAAVQSESESTGNLSRICPTIISKGSDDVAMDICSSFASSSSNQTNIL
jgi:hypothetical protein